MLVLLLRSLLTVPMLITESFAKHFAQDWIESWNAHDLSRVLAHYDDEFEMSSPRIVQIFNEPSGVLKGKALVAAYWQKALGLMPNLKFTLLGVYAGATSLAIHYSNERGGYASEVFTFDDSGKVIRAAANYKISL